MKIFRRSNPGPTEATVSCGAPCPTPVAAAPSWAYSGDWLVMVQVVACFLPSSVKATVN